MAVTQAQFDKVFEHVTNNTIMCDFVERYIKDKKYLPYVMFKRIVNRLMKIDDDSFVQRILEIFDRYNHDIYHIRDIKGRYDYQLVKYIYRYSYSYPYDFIEAYMKLSIKAVEAYSEHFKLKLSDKSAFTQIYLYFMMKEAGSDTDLICKKLQYLLDQLRAANVSDADITEIFNRKVEKCQFSTALQYAAGMQYGNVVQILLTVSGIDLNGALTACASTGGYVPRSQFVYDANIPTLLIKAGAVPTEADYEMAVLNGHPFANLFKPPCVAAAKPDCPDNSIEVSVPDSPGTPAVKLNEVFIKCHSVHNILFRIEVLETPSDPSHLYCFAKVTALSIDGIDQYDRVKVYYRKDSTDAAHMSFIDKKGSVIALTNINPILLKAFESITPIKTYVKVPVVPKFVKKV